MPRKHLMQNPESPTFVITLLEVVHITALRHVFKNRCSGNHLHFKLMWRLRLGIFKERGRKRKSWDKPGLDHTGRDQKKKRRINPAHL